VDLPLSTASASKRINEQCYDKRELIWVSSQVAISENLLGAGSLTKLASLSSMEGEKNQVCAQLWEGSVFIWEEATTREKAES